MSKFAYLTLHVMRGSSPRIHEAVRQRKPYVVDASSWIAGSSPAMTNVGFWQNEPEDYGRSFWQNEPEHGETTMAR